MNQSAGEPNLITPAERRWVLIYAIVVMLVTSLPYLLAFAMQSPSWRFTGFVFGVEDGNSYIAKMLGGAAGAWLFRSPYSTEYQMGVVAFLPYLLLGKLTAPPGLHEQLVAIYHLFRIVAGILVILATYDFIAVFSKLVRLRRLGLILVSLGGGLGWLLILLGRSQWQGSLPLDFYSPETFGFLALFGIPHLALARATMLWGLVVYLRISGDYDQKWHRNSLKLGGLWLVTAVAQPITAVVLGIVMALHLAVSAGWYLYRRRQKRPVDWWLWLASLRTAFVAGLIVLPFMIYNLFAFSLDPYLRSWTDQNIIRSPQPVHYLLAYGLLSPFAFLGARKLLHRDPWRGCLLVAWVIALPVLAYVPFNLQRRLPDGIWVALVALAIISLEGVQVTESQSGPEGVSSRRTDRRQFVFLFLFISTLFLFVGGVMAAIHPSQPVFRPTEEVRAFQFFTQQSNQGEVVLASFNTGNAIPAWAPVRVVIGHGPESVGLNDLNRMVSRFFQLGMPDQLRLKFLREQNVRYVFWGPEEREIGGWDPYQADYLVPVYHQGDYSIFEVNVSG
jgi:hypothetical protein